MVVSEKLKDDRVKAQKGHRIKRENNIVHLLSVLLNPKGKVKDGFCCLAGIILETITNLFI